MWEANYSIQGFQAFPSILYYSNAVKPSSVCLTQSLGTWNKVERSTAQWAAFCIRELACVLDTLLLIQVHANVPGKAKEDGSGPGAPAYMWETRMEAESPAFPLAHPGLCGYLGSEPADFHLFLSLSLSCYYSVLQVKNKNLYKHLFAYKNKMERFSWPPACVSGQVVECIGNSLKTFCLADLWSSQWF